jgi:hypothetical protein
MARKPWDALSSAYRKRLEAAGISRLQHAAGAGLREARGHREAPERPGRLGYRQRVERAGRAIRLMRTQNVAERDAARRVGLSVRSLRSVFREFGVLTRGQLRRLHESEASRVPFPVGGTFEPIWVEPAGRVRGVHTGVASDIGRYHNDIKAAMAGRGDLRHWRGRVVLTLEGNVHPYVTDIDALRFADTTMPEPWETLHIGGS